LTRAALTFALIVLCALAAGSDARAGEVFVPAPGLRTLEGETLRGARGWRGVIALDEALSAPGEEAERLTFEVEAVWGDQRREPLPEKRKDAGRSSRERSWTFPLAASPSGAATLREDVAPDARDMRYELKAGPRLRIRWTTDRSRRDAAAKALDAGDDAALAHHPASRLASLLLQAKGPLAPDEIRLRVDAATVEVEGRATPLAPLGDEDLWTTLRLPAGPGTRVTLSVVASVVTRAPYLDRLEERAAPLSASTVAEARLSQGGASVKGAIDQADGRLRFAPLDVHGERMGSWSVRLADGSQELDGLVRDGLVLLRYGRPCEAALDRGEPPSRAPIPEGTTAGALPAVVLARVAASVNPDTGTLPWLSSEALAPLAAAAPEAWRALGLGTAAATGGGDPGTQALVRGAASELAQHAVAWAAAARSVRADPSDEEAQEDVAKVERGLAQIAQAWASLRGRAESTRDLAASVRSLLWCVEAGGPPEPSLREPARRALDAVVAEALRRLLDARPEPLSLEDEVELAAAIAAAARSR